MVAVADTPMMRQFWSIKNQHPNELLFYRMGDFYEMFFEDAKKAASALNIALTTRGKHLGEDIPMCGVPVHSSESYLLELIRGGHRVAVCEQMENPKEARSRGARSVVQREVVRVLTPGTLTEDTLLQARSNNFLAAWSEVRDDAAFAWIDLSTGEFRVSPCPRPMLGAMAARIAPREALLPDRLCDDQSLVARLREEGAHVTPLGPGSFDSASAAGRLEKLFRVATLEPFGQFSRAELSAMGALADYVELTQRGATALLRPPVREANEESLQIDPATRRNLELSSTLSGGRAGSLLETVDRTVTSAGARLLESRLASPATDLAEIGRRHDSVAWFSGERDRAGALGQILRGVPDLERAITRLALERGGPRDLGALRAGLDAAGRAHAELDHPSLPQEMAEAARALSGHAALLEHLNAALGESLPPSVSEGGFIAAGYRPELDEARELRDEGRRGIDALQQRYRDETGIAPLRIRQNNVLGYFVEVNERHARKLEASPHDALFSHRQTISSAVRFSTVALSDLERRIAGARAHAQALEQEIFTALRAEALTAADAITAAARAFAAIDVALGFARIASEENWTRPEMSDDLVFEVTEGRHPVVERSLRETGGEPFVANNCNLTAAGRSATPLWIVTGPNMAGKSTFLRQNALIAILAQAGAFVPAKRARIGIVDRLFSRVGAADDLARGRSTFMVEMVETAAILHQAGERSLVILDEIGRGTATYDGLSIAWAVLEHLRAVNRSRALFATHYHELTRLAETLDGVRNATVRVREWEGELIFLHEVTDGVADRSYGVQVARLAGLPETLIARAAELLEDLENRETGTAAGDPPTLPSLFDPPPPEYWSRPRQAGDSQLRERILELDPDGMTPREALEALYGLQKLAIRHGQP